MLVRLVLRQARRLLLVLLLGGLLGATLVRLGPGFGLDERELDTRLSAETRQAIHAEHALRALENAAIRVGRALTVHAAAAPPSAGLALALEAAETEHPELLAQIGNAISAR